MKHKNNLICYFILIFLVSGPGFLWPKGSSFKKDLTVFHKNPRNGDLREKIIQEVLSMKSSPALPSAAVSLKSQAKEDFEKSQFKEAAKALSLASDWAPWDAGTYSDLAQAQENAGFFPDAMQSLNLYLLASPQAEDRQKVQDRIGKLGEENKKWMADQIEHLDVEAVGNSLAARLVEMGPAAKIELPFLTQALKKNDEDTRANAAQLLGQMGPAAAPAIPALADRLDDPVTNVKEKASDALSKLGPSVVQVLPDLIDSLRDEDAFIRTSIAIALGNIGPGAAKAVPALAKALKDRDLRVRADAAYALAKIGPAAKDALPALEAMSNDSDPTARKNAAVAIKQINTKAE
jgi:HEAT repeat protein